MYLLTLSMLLQYASLSLSVCAMFEGYDKLQRLASYIIAVQLFTSTSTPIITLNFSTRAGATLMNRKATI